MAARPLTRLPSFGDLAAWQAIELLFSKHFVDLPPTQLRDELVNVLLWAQFGQDVSDNADAIRAVRKPRPAYGDTYYET